LGTWEAIITVAVGNTAGAVPVDGEAGAVGAYAVCCAWMVGAAWHRILWWVMTSGFGKAFIGGAFIVVIAGRGVTGETQSTYTCVSRGARISVFTGVGVDDEGAGAVDACVICTWVVVVAWRFRSTGNTAIDGCGDASNQNMATVFRAGVSIVANQCCSRQTGALIARIVFRAGIAVFTSGFIESMDTDLLGATDVVCTEIVVVAIALDRTAPAFRRDGIFTQAIHTCFAGT